MKRAARTYQIVYLLILVLVAGAAGVPATTAASAHAGAIVISATKEPAAHRPSTICHVGAGDSQGFDAQLLGQAFRTK